MPAPAPRPELLAFLAAIKAEPDDNTPKLVLADWLQEQPSKADQARGEYLRELVRWHATERGTPAYDAGYKRITQLWSKHHKAWFGELAAVGFDADYLNIPWGLLDASIDGTKAVTKKAAAVAGTEAYAWVGKIAFHRIGSTHLVKFADSPLLDSLAGLSLNNCDVRMSSIEAVVNSPRAAGLKYLGLSKVPAPGVAIAHSPHMSKLRELYLWYAHTTDAEFKCLGNSPHLNELRSLTVSNGSLTIHAARAFTEATGLSALTELNLGGTNRIGPDGTLILVASPSTGRLRKLNLWSNGIADYGVEAICRQPHMNRLTHLDVSGNLLTNRAAVAIAGAEHLGTLEELDLRTNNISGEGALALAKAPHLKNIKQLNLLGNNIGANVGDALRERFGTALLLN